MKLAVLKTKLGAARTVALKSFDGSRNVVTFPVSATGRALTHEESLRPLGSAFRGIHLATDGKYGRKRPFRGVFGLVGGRGRVLLYDRFGLAARWEEEKPRFRRRGLKFTASAQEILEGLWQAPLALLGYPGAYLCPACGAAKVESVPAPGYMPIPLCATCFSKGPGERDWVGNWQCVHCGDRVKDEILECPFCAQLASEKE
jgi:rubrerythrin